MRRTKIVCTLGPASGSEKVLKEMLRAGMNVARLNFSHGSYDDHAKMIETFRKVRDELDVPAALLLDTKGPEIRLGTVKNSPVTLKAGDVFVLTAKDVEGDGKIASVSYKNLPEELSSGDEVLIDDGKISLTVTRVDGDDIYTRVNVGGEISTHKGVNVPRKDLKMTYMSERDKADVLFGIEHDVDFIAASFVRSKDDVIDLRRFIDYNGGHNIKIIAKIENLQGVENFGEILKHSDGIMVARGDMGVEIEYERLPGLQKRFIRECYQSGKVVICATQMLESMINNKMPTRAEITDVANAVFDGTSAVMLSGETAIGKDPVHVVEVMAKIAERAENDAMELGAYRNMSHDIDYADTTNAICDAACTTARDMKASAVIAVTKSGETARRVSKFRPEQPIIAATTEEKTFHQLSLSWGVFPVHALPQYDTEMLFRHAIDCGKMIDLIKSGDRVVITGGAPLNVSGTTNIIKVQTVDSI